MGYVRKERTQKRRQAVLTGEKKKKHLKKDSTRSLKIRRDERELERIDDKPTPDIEDQNSKEDSDEQPDIQL